MIIISFPKIENTTLHAIEICLNFVVVADILLRASVLGFNKYKNKFIAALDIATVVACILAITFSIMAQGEFTAMETMGDELLLVVVCVAQYLRIVSFFKTQRQMAVMLSEESLLTVSLIG